MHPTPFRFSVTPYRYTDASSTPVSSVSNSSSSVAIPILPAMRPDPRPQPAPGPLPRCVILQPPSRSPALGPPEPTEAPETNKFGKVTIEKARSLISGMGGACLSTECLDRNAIIEVRCGMGHVFSESYTAFSKRRLTGPLCRTCTQPSKGSAPPKPAPKRKGPSTVGSKTMETRPSTIEALMALHGSVAGNSAASDGSGPGSGDPIIAEEPEMEEPGDKRRKTVPTPAQATHSSSDPLDSTHPTQLLLQSRAEKALLAHAATLRNGVADSMREALEGLYPRSIASRIEEDVRTSPGTIECSLKYTASCIADFILQAGNRQLMAAVQNLGRAD